MPVTLGAAPVAAAYRDPKRHAWLLSLGVPAAVGAGPSLWLALMFCAWFLARHDLPWHGVLASVLIGGGVGGFSINLGHELGHKGTVLERWLAKAVLALTGYGRFNIEHNRGHHRHVATAADPASSRMGENIYAFMCREMPGAARRAWVLEAQRLRANGRPVWSMQNQILQPALMTLALWSGLAPWLGVAILLFLLHLQRHSDHHAHPLRCYQSLRHFEDLPQLPKGYFGMFVIAYLPPLRCWLMDRRLLEVVGRDPARINFHPAQRERLLREHGLEGAT